MIIILYFKNRGIMYSTQTYREGPVDVIVLIQSRANSVIMYRQFYYRHAARHEECHHPPKNSISQFHGITENITGGDDLCAAK
jgi:hypothetical protein